MSKEKKKISFRGKFKLLIWSNAIALVISVGALVFVAFRCEPYEFDSVNFCIAAMGVVISAYLIWQIWSSISLKSDLKEIINKQQREMKTLFAKKQRELEKTIDYKIQYEEHKIAGPMNHHIGLLNCKPGYYNMAWWYFIQAIDDEYNLGKIEDVTKLSLQEMVKDKCLQFMSEEDKRLSIRVLSLVNEDWAFDLIHFVGSLPSSPSEEQ